MTHTYPSYIDTLNAVQKQAALTTEGPVLVLAGAGTGKTRVLIARLSYLVESQKAFSGQILAVTFTNKAANEMKERTENFLGHSIQGLWLGTFHAIAARILRKHAQCIDLPSNFNIIGIDDQLRVIKQILELEGHESSKSTTKTILAIIESWKDRGLTPEKITETELHTSSKKVRFAAQIYPIYQERLKNLSAVDFGDLLLHTLTIFEKYPDILKMYQVQFQYILVDEYQDTNIAQYLWLRLLAQYHGNLCCVGDDDQSIYGWRGAEVGNILKFEKDFPQATVIRLEQNYRSTSYILDAASAIIAHNSQRLGKTLWTDKKGGDKIHVKPSWDSYQEARWIAEEIETLQRQKVSLNTIAILVRSGYQTREFEECFTSIAIPYRIIGGVKFYERQEVRDALAYLRLAVQPQDGLAFDRVINKPKRGIGDVSLQKIHKLSRDIGSSLFDASKQLIATDELGTKVKAQLTHFIDLINEWHESYQTQELTTFVEGVLEKSGYLEMWRKDRSVESLGRIENLKELVNAIAEFPDLPSFLEHISLIMDTAQDALYESVVIMTMHSAKGLEYEYVFLAGWEEGVFPSQRLNFDSQTDIEEERRLAYVGLTRAKTRAYISFSGSRRIHGQWQSNPPSRFLREIPQEHVYLLSQNSFLEQKHQKHSLSQETSLLSKVEDQKSSKEKKASVLYEGCRVFHRKFGYGYIIDLHGDHVTINFEHTGYKKVISSFITAVNK